MAEWYRSGAIINGLHRLCNTALTASIQVARPPRGCLASFFPTMSTSPPRNPSRANSAARKRGRAKSDWLASSLTTAKAVAAGAECIPFPYVKDAFGIVVVILETVGVWSLINSGNLTHVRPQKVKKNRDDLKELCDSIMGITGIVQEQLSSHAHTPALDFRNLCQELEGWLFHFSVLTVGC